MEEIITAVYKSIDTLNNVHDDLVSSGIPEDNIRIDRDKRQVQVMGSAVTEAEYKEILQRHSPVEIRTS
jgi:hypothetical protein